MNNLVLGKYWSFWSMDNDVHRDNIMRLSLLKAIQFSMLNFFRERSLQFRDPKSLNR